MKNGKSFNSRKIFKGYIHIEKKQIPQYLFSRCGMTHLIYCLKKIRKTIKLQEELLKTASNHDEFDEIISR